MGCGSSKGVAPAPGPQPAAASPAKDTQRQQPAAGSDAAAALHKQRLEQQHSHKLDGAQHEHQQQQGDMCLPGRIESTTARAPPANLLKELPEVVDLPPLRKSDPAKAAADAEFDYGKELQRGAALGSRGGAPPVSSAEGGVVGGLLSKQPDWLRGSNSTDPSTGKLPALAQAQGAVAPVGKAASSLPPLVGRGMGATAGGGGSSSLPPLGAGGARALVPADSQHKPKEAESDEEGPALHAAGGTAHAGKQAPLDKHADSSSSSSSASSSRRSSPAHAPTSTAAAVAAAAGLTNTEPADPWNSLQSQYAHGSPSPDSSTAGGSPPAAAVAPTDKAGVGAPGASSLPPLHGSAAAGTAAAAAGSRMTTGSKQQPEARQELVLVDSDDETAEPKQQQQQQHKAGGALAAAGTNRSSFSSSSGGGRISAQASQHSVGSGAPHVAKSGGWGVSSLAGAGTIMLGDESSRRSPGIPQTTAAAAGAGPAGAKTAAGHDDVFGDDDYEAPVLPKGLGAHAASLAPEGSSSSSSSLLRASHSRARVGAAPAAATAAAVQQETLAVEEIEDDFDTDHMMQSRGGLPADLAAKLAQFKAGGAHSDEEGNGSESPTIFAMMNNRQGSWRAA